MFGRWRKRQEDDLPPIDRAAVHAAIEARLIEAIDGRTDVRYEIAACESDDQVTNWWIDISAGGAEAEIIASPNGQHMVTEDDYGWFERTLDGHLLTDFIQSLQ